MAKKILVVEDDALIRQGLHDSLNIAGYEVIDAADGRQGYDVALDMKPDLVLLDFFMPVMNGQEMLEKLRKNSWGKTVPVIFLTNNNDVISINEALLKDVKDYVIKAETSSEKLVEIIEKALA